MSITGEHCCSNSSRRLLRYHGTQVAIASAVVLPGAGLCSLVSYALSVVRSIYVGQLAKIDIANDLSQNKESTGWSWNVNSCLNLQKSKNRQHLAEDVESRCQQR